jgi:HEAT repeat
MSAKGTTTKTLWQRLFGTNAQPIRAASSGAAEPAASNNVIQNAAANTESEMEMLVDRSLQLLKDESPVQRLAAAEALKQVVKAEGLVPLPIILALQELLDDQDPTVREWARDYVAIWSGNGAFTFADNVACLPGFVTALQRSDDSLIRKLGAKFLPNWPSDAVRDALQAALTVEQDPSAKSKIEDSLRVVKAALHDREEEPTRLKDIEQALELLTVKNTENWYRLFGNNHGPMSPTRGGTNLIESNLQRQAVVQEISARSKSWERPQRRVLLEPCAEDGALVVSIYTITGSYPKSLAEKDVVLRTSTDEYLLYMSWLR